MPKINRTPEPTPTEPTYNSVWAGPESTAPNGGITSSLLSRFLCCRERFRLLVVEGLQPVPQFNHRLEYGNMWHICEEHHSRGKDYLAYLQDYVRQLCLRYPTQQNEIVKWFRVCKVQFPVYVQHWQNHPDNSHRVPLFQEQVFAVRYTLPSGRSVILRGKWDAVDLIGSYTAIGICGVYLQENKTKGNINPGQIKQQLSFDLQTMLYLIALQEEQSRLDDSTIKNKLSYRGLENGTPNPHGTFRHYYPIKGVRYNVVRRPLSGGKGTISKHKDKGKVGGKSYKPAETDDQFYSRLVNDYIAADPGYYFMRWRVEVHQHDIDRFRHSCLNPILEQLCDWWQYILAHDKVIDDYTDVWSFNKTGIHFRLPFGIYNPIADGGSSELDDYLATGSSLGLTNTTNLFPEL